ADGEPFPLLQLQVPADGGQGAVPVDSDRGADPGAVLRRSAARAAGGVFAVSPVRAGGDAVGYRHPSQAPTSRSGMNAMLASQTHRARVLRALGVVVWRRRESAVVAPVAQALPPEP